MPAWYVTSGCVECPEPWAVMDAATGRAVGCHPIERDANEHLAALLEWTRQYGMSDN